MGGGPIVSGWSGTLPLLFYGTSTARTPILKEVYECVIQARRAQRRNRLSKPFSRIFKSSFTM